MNPSSYKLWLWYFFYMYVFLFFLTDENFEKVGIRYASSRHPEWFAWKQAAEVAAKRVPSHQYPHNTGRRRADTIQQPSVVD